MNNSNINFNNYGQQGGFAGFAQNVNLGIPPRKMNPSLEAGLVQHIPKSADVDITAVMGDGEALSFAHQIMDWMKRNGYNKVEGVSQAIFNQPVKGQIIEKNEQSNGFKIIVGNIQ